MHRFNPRVCQNWFNVIRETYVLLKPGVNPANMEEAASSHDEAAIETDFGKEDFDALAKY